MNAAAGGANRPPLRHIIAVALAIACAAIPAAPAAPVDAAARYAVVNVFPHDPNAWTQGLAFRKGKLYETTGLYGRSSLRRVDLATGRVLQIRRLADRYFAEGLAFLGGKAWVLTWRENRVLLFDPVSFARVGRFDYAGEGWGLTSNGTQLVMSNGSERIRFRDPRTFRTLRQITVTEAGRPVTLLNELEWVNGRIWANVWLVPQVVIIDPRDGKVVERIDFSGLLERERAIGSPREMNGIAYLASAGRLFVTGKYWKHVYEVRLTTQ
ncbi:MAG: glutaminyl-peptide cyclotransferase [Chloroflexota bacterium]|nr:glutaminyl-peptide cyclotransferase [Chloroflexota bacterium]